jgi:hypothetical protein
MSEMAKTLTFVALAAVSLLAAFMPTASNKDFDYQEEVGKRLNEFYVEDAKRLRIITFDQETASTRDFEVAEEDGLWTIPSKQGYPADAVKQMAEAATCLIDREVLRIAAENASQHVELGLLDPTSSNLDIETAGVGTRVSMTDINGKSLADMIIGKQVPDTEDQRYVRNANQDVAYVVNLQTNALTTRFEDWIEKDLLNLNPLDVRRVHIKDYSAEFQPVLTPSGIQFQATWDRRGEMQLRYDDADSKWVAERLQKFEPNEKVLVDYTLGENETLNEDALRELRNGLDDLAIVDVERKPAGLSADLKAGSDFVKNQAAQTSLISRGFAPLPASDGSDGSDLEMLSSEGEITCTLENGVEYVLRFGNLQLQGDTDASVSADETDEADADDGIHRYLFVMARFNEAIVEKPELTDLPELPEEGEEEEAEEAATEDDDASQASNEESNEDQAPEDSEESEDSGSEAEEETSTEDEEPVETEETEESELSKLIAERKAIEDENRRLLDEYQQKLTAAKQTVQELNERFGDWYYVIDNKVYKQIHLSREDVIQAKEDEAAEAAAPPPGIGLPGLPNLSPKP